MKPSDLFKKIIARGGSVRAIITEDYLFHSECGEQTFEMKKGITGDIDTDAGSDKGFSFAPDELELPVFHFSCKSQLCYFTIPELNYYPCLAENS